MLVRKFERESILIGISGCLDMGECFIRNQLFEQVPTYKAGASEYKCREFPVRRHA